MNLKGFFLKNFTSIEIKFVSAILLFSVLVRLLSFTVICLILVALFVFTSIYFFYSYVNKLASNEKKLEVKEDYSWGFVREEIKRLDLDTFFTFLKGKDFSFYKEFLIEYKNYITLFILIFGDFIVAFKNLSLNDAGIYFAMSLFCKFIFLAYIYFEGTYKKVQSGDFERESKILNIFYGHLNGLLSLSFVLLILFFLISRPLVEVFFGQSYLYYQTTLPFILAANLSMLVALLVFNTSKLLDHVATRKILKIYLPIFSLLFVFMSITSIDTVSYFVIAAASLLSVFLYNFAIKKPEYILHTYNSLF